MFAVILVALIGGTGLVSLLSAADDSAAAQLQYLQPAEGRPAAETGGMHDAQSHPGNTMREDPRTAGRSESKQQEDLTPHQASPVVQPAQDASASPSVMPADQTVLQGTTPAGTPAQADVAKPDADPRIIELVHPVFTPELQAMPSGDVIVMAQIDATGKVVRTMVAKSTNPAFNQAIVTAVLRSTFAPGITDSQPAVKWITIPFRVN